jgi:hypothetical protein
MKQDILLDDEISLVGSDGDVDGRKALSSVADVTKLFSSSLTLKINKLECLSVKSLFRSRLILASKDRGRFVEKLVLSSSFGLEQIHLSVWVTHCCAA